MRTSVVTAAQPPFQPADEPCKEHDHYEVYECNDDKRQEGRIGCTANNIARLGEIADRYIAGNGGLLEQDDELVCERRQNIFLKTCGIIMYCIVRT